MAKSELMLKARKLRKEGSSIGAIARNLHVSKSSASLWCKDVRLTTAQAAKLLHFAISAGNKGRLLGAKANRDAKRKRIADFEIKGRAETQNLSAHEILLIGAAIYWGEGSKIGQLSFVNSDKNMILFMYKWFQFALGVRKDEFMPRVYINEVHKRRRITIEKYWSRLLNIPIEQFRTTVFIKRRQTKAYENYSRYYGLLSLRIRNSTNLKYRILGLIEGLKCSSF